MKVHLCNVQHKRLVLSNTKKLKGLSENFQKIYITPDLSLKGRQENKLLRANMYGARLPPNEKACLICSLVLHPTSPEHATWASQLFPTGRRAIWQHNTASLLNISSFPYYILVQILIHLTYHINTLEWQRTTGESLGSYLIFLREWDSLCLMVYYDTCRDRCSSSNSHVMPCGIGE